MKTQIRAISDKNTDYCYVCI